MHTPSQSSLELHSNLLQSCSKQNSSHDSQKKVIKCTEIYPQQEVQTLLTAFPTTYFWSVVFTVQTSDSPLPPGWGTSYNGLYFAIRGKGFLFQAGVLLKGQGFHELNYREGQEKLSFRYLKGPFKTSRTGISVTRRCESFLGFEMIWGILRIEIFWWTFFGQKDSYNNFLSVGKSVLQAQVYVKEVPLSMEGILKSYFFCQKW